LPPTNNQADTPYLDNNFDGIAKSLLRIQQLWFARMFWLKKKKWRETLPKGRTSLVHGKSAMRRAVAAKGFTG
jgi:hypothetical protein